MHQLIQQLKVGHEFKSQVLGRTRVQKRFILVVNDVAIWLFALWAAIAIRLGDITYFPPSELHIMFVVAPVVGVASFHFLNLYHQVTRYFSSSGFFRVMIAVSQTVLIWSLVYQMARITGMPRSSVIIWWVLSFLLLWSSRQLAAWFLLGIGAQPQAGKNVIIYGAGETGSRLAKILEHSIDLNPIAFVDDHHSLQGQEMMGLKVFDPDFIEKLVREYDVEELLLAIPSATQNQRRQIIARIETLKISVRTVPGMMELAEGRVEVNDLRAVRIDDLLGRSPVPPVVDLMDRNLRGKNILVTGAGGSIGSELCRQIILNGARRLVMLDISEFALYSIDQELNGLLSNSPPWQRPEIVSVLGSVLQEGLIDATLREHEIDTVFHAAAYKHVPLVEHNAAVGLRNNTFGTYCVAEASARYGVGAFVLVSTDKAVRPTNVMGASKRLSELVIQAHAAQEGNRTAFACVRFGNVLGSSGSVVPKFREQIKKGGPVTVTHPNMVRYFMSIPEAAQLVIQAGSMASAGAEIYVLDMGEAVEIDKLARSMIRLMGREVCDKDNPDGDIEIVYSGLRSGEKLYEELLIDDAADSTEHPRVFRVDEAYPDLSELRSELVKIEQAMLDGDEAMIHQLLKENVEGFVSRLDSQDLLVTQAKPSRMPADKVARVQPLTAVS